MRFMRSVVTRPTREQTGCWRRSHFPHPLVHHLHHYLVFHLSCFFLEGQENATHSRHLLRAPVDAIACFPSVFPVERRFPPCQGAVSTYLLVRKEKSSLSLMRLSTRKSPLDWGLFTNFGSLIHPWPLTGILRASHLDEEGSENTGNFVPYSIRQVCGFFSVP